MDGRPAAASGHETAEDCDHDNAEFKVSVSPLLKALG